jgi:hypothetical protein
MTETEFIENFVSITDCSDSFARGVFIHLDLYRARVLMDRTQTQYLNSSCRMPITKQDFRPASHKLPLSMQGQSPSFVPG